MEKLLEKYGKLIFFQARCAKNGGFTRYSIESPVYEYYIYKHDVSFNETHNQ